MLPSSARKASVLLVIQSVCVYVCACVCVCPPMSAVPTLCSPCLLAIMILMVRPPVESPFVSHSLAWPLPPLLSLPLPLCVSAVWQLRVTRHCSLHFQFATLSHIIAMSADARVESPLNASLFQFTFNIYAHFSNTPTRTQSDKLSRTLGGCCDLCMRLNFVACF